MDVNAIAFGILVFIAGVLATILVTRWVTPRYARATRLEISLYQTGNIYPPQLGLPNTGIRIGNRSLGVAWVLEVEVRNTGPRDLVIAETLQPQFSPPRIDFSTGIKVPFDPGLLRNEPGVDVRLARQFSNAQHIYIHIHRLPRRTSAVFQLIATDEPTAQRPRLTGLDQEHVAFFRGTLIDVDVRCRKLLAPPPALLKN